MSGGEIGNKFTCPCLGFKSSDVTVHRKKKASRPLGPRKDLKKYCQRDTYSDLIKNFLQHALHIRHKRRMECTLYPHSYENLQNFVPTTQNLWSCVQARLRRWCCHLAVLLSFMIVNQDQVGILCLAIQAGHSRYSAYQRNSRRFSCASGLAKIRQTLGYLTPTSCFRTISARNSLWKILRKPEKFCCFSCLLYSLRYLINHMHS